MKFNKKMILYISILMLSFPLVGCIKTSESSKDFNTIVDSAELWKQNPVEVVSRYINNMGKEDKYNYIYSDMNNDKKINSEFKGQFEGGYFNLGEPLDKDEGKNQLKEFNDSVKSVRFIGAKPSSSQGTIENPIKVKNTKEEVLEYKNPIVIMVSFDIKLNKKNNSVSYNEGLNSHEVILIRDKNNDYKILHIGG
ncbi:hypothetical protein [Peptostreptococcus faecalis]|uniref:hypothetical protein n=1 Tax=Peptostreptococcus faecalis TaxID=2045015 RepID=UPI000C7D6959|nr:hypothetical protein [Peptostreptococcus faecalis]